MSLDIMTPRLTASPFTRANPLSKLAAVGMVTVVVMLSVDWVSAGVVLAAELLLMPVLGISAWALFRRGWPLVVAALVGAYGTALLAEKTGAVVFEAGPLLFTEDSINSGVAIGLRSLAVALPGIFLLLTTDPTDLADALAQKLKLPHRFVLGALAGLRLVGLLVDEWRTLGLARHARGVGAENKPLAKLTAFLGQAFGLIVQAIRRATRLAVAMEARGFGGAERTWARESTFSRVDIWVFLGGALVSTAAVAAAVSAGTWNFIFG
ncbi:MAG TPA: energy-coupling factor transporter transmembrane component T [Arthrobacter sp.]|jgi:energy-coupling factor transport system permease protein|nr:energy-coupling factor transporter transmembrane component T [Arthrobacter sp.]